MSATIHLSRPFQLADAAWPYQIVVDGQAAGNITNRRQTKLQIAPGTHTVQIRSLHILPRHLGLGSPTVTFDVSDGATADFVCHSRPFPQIIFWLVACLAGNRSRWIILRRADSGAPASAR